MIEILLLLIACLLAGVVVLLVQIREAVATLCVRRPDVEVEPLPTYRAVDWDDEVTRNVEPHWLSRFCRSDVTG